MSQPSGAARTKIEALLAHGPELICPARHSSRGMVCAAAAVFAGDEPVGVFAAGDVRHRALKRVASAVGEGSMAVHCVHQALREP